MPMRISKLIGTALLAFSIGCASYAPSKAMAPMEPTSEYGGGEAAPSADDAPGSYGDMTGEMVDGRLASVAPVLAPNPGPTGGAQTVATEVQSPLLIYTATMNLAVFQVSEASKQVETMARESGGFLARRDDTSIVIRVPAGKFDDIILRIEKLGDVLHRNVSAEDVTEQYMDIEVRLKNARAVRDRLQGLLEKATKVEESLAIEKELTRVGTEIETLEGKLKYLKDRVRFSTITVSFQAKRSDSVKPSVRIPVDWLDQLGLGRLLNL